MAGPKSTWTRVVGIINDKMYPYTLFHFYIYFQAIEFLWKIYQQYSRSSFFNLETFMKILSTDGWQRARQIWSPCPCSMQCTLWFKRDNEKSFPYNITDSNCMHVVYGKPWLSLACMQCSITAVSFWDCLWKCMPYSHYVL